MKRIAKILILCTVTIFLIIGLVACGENKVKETTCNHTYDNDCDANCNSCGEERSVTHSFSKADCTAPKTCSVCKATEGEKAEHSWIAADCYSPKTCSVCKYTDGKALGHTPNSDDGDCTTAITCQVCNAVTTPAEAEHIPSADDDNCATPTTCVKCTKILVEAKPHVPSEDDGDCTTALKCTNCSQNALDAKAHSITKHAYDESTHWLVCANDGCIANNKNEFKSDPIYIIPEFISSTSSFENEGGLNLFDGNVNTKWCSNVITDGNIDIPSTHVIFGFDTEIKLYSYALTTANDTAAYQNRNWKSWKIYGSDTYDDDNNWVEIHSVENANLPAEDYCASEPFTVNATTAYKYYKLEILTTMNTEDGINYIQQMSEISIKGFSNTQEPHYGGKANCKMGKVCEVCEFMYTSDTTPEIHNFNSDGICELCSEKAIIKVYAGNEFIAYTSSDTELRQILLNTLNNGKNIITIDLPKEIPYSTFRAIRDALIKTNTDKIELTLNGLTEILDHNDDNPTFGFSYLEGSIISKLDKIYLPDVTSIGRNAFDNAHISYIYAPKIKEIRRHAFFDCSKLTTVIFADQENLNNSVIAADGAAFEYINPFATLTISCVNSVNIIDNNYTGNRFDVINFVHTPNDSCVCQNCSATDHFNLNSTTGECEKCNTFIAVASITSQEGTKYYKSFEDALSAWTENTKLTLYKDIYNSSKIIEITDKGLTLDLNGYALSSKTTSIHVKENASLTLSNSNSEKIGKIVGAIAIKNDGELTFASRIELDGTSYELHINSPVTVACDLQEYTWVIHMDSYGKYVTLEENGKIFNAIPFDESYSLNSNRTEFQRVN